MTQRTAFIGPLPSEPDDFEPDAPQRQRKPGDDPFSVPPGGLLAQVRHDNLLQIKSHNQRKTEP